MQQTAHHLATCRTTQERKQYISTFCKSFNDIHLCVIWHEQHSPALPHNPAPFTIDQIQAGTNWITLPTFQDLSATQEAQFKHILRALPSLRTARTIVFDLRGNAGGNTSYGDKIVETLFTQDYAQYKKSSAESEQYCEWRATPDNHQHIVALSQTIADGAWLSGIARGIQESISKGEPFYKEVAQPHNTPAPTTPNPFTAHIICITEHCNASAALDFLDYLHTLDSSITLIGQPTQADRLYMELHLTPLPSGTGSLGHPIKVYRNRPRGDNQPYTPHTIYKDDMSDTKALQDFVLKTTDPAIEHVRHNFV